MKEPAVVIVLWVIIGARHLTLTLTLTLTIVLWVIIGAPPNPKPNPNPNPPNPNPNPGPIPDAWQRGGASHRAASHSKTSRLK